MPSPWAAVRNSTLPDTPPPDPGPWAEAPLPPPVTSSSGPKAIYAPDARQQMIDTDQARLRKVQYAQDHPWGTPENHPGKLGKLAHIFSEVGNVAGNIVAPNIMAEFPETQLGRKAEEGRLSGRLDKELENQATEKERGATAAHTEAETPEVAPNAESQRALQGAQESNLESETKMREHPLPEYQLDPRFLTSEGQPVTFEKHSGHFAPGDITGLYSPTSGNKMQSKPGIWNGQNTFGNYNPLTGKYTNPDTGEIMEGFQPFAPFSQVPNIQPYPVYNPGTQNFGIGGFNTKSGSVVMPRPGAPTPVPANVFGELNKNLEDARSADTRFRVMSDSVPAALHGDQQAMVNILTNHLGMTMGLQKGARITKDLYKEAEFSAPWLARVQAHFDNDGYLTGAVLTPEQIHTMVGLGQDRRMRQWQQAADAAKTYGMPIGDLMPKDLQHPGPVLNPPGGQSAPPGATQEVYKGGKLIGHVVNGKYIALGGK